MSNPMVVDTSVAFKWLHREGEGAVDEAAALLGAHLSGEIVLVAPATLPVEIANGLRYSRLSRNDVMDALEGFELLHVEVLENDSTRIAHATALSYAHDLSVYDALFLALAEELKCPLVTADRRAFEGIDTRVDVRLL